MEEATGAHRGSVLGLIGRQWRLLLGFAISAAFLLWALRQISSFETVGTVLSQANYVYAIPAVAVYFVGVWFRAVRWQVLLGPLRPLSAARLFPVVVVGYMANNVLPARLGELVRAYILGEREGVSKSAVLATIVVERTFDGLTMIIFMLIAGLTVALDDTLRGIMYSSAAVFVVALAAFVVVAASPARAVALITLLLRPLPDKVRRIVADVVAKFVDGLSVLGSIRNVLLVLATSIAAWSAEAAMYWLLGLGFALPVGPQAYLLTTAVANIGGMLPSSPGYVGTFEWFSMTALSVFGLGSDQALSYILALHAFLLAPVTLLGLAFLWRLGLSLRVLRRVGQGSSART